MFEIGQIVISKSGRDKQKPFIVVTIEDDFLYLVDGNLRRVAKPKKKKKKHIQPTKTVVVSIQEALKQSRDLQDACFRKALDSFEEK